MKHEDTDDDARRQSSSTSTTTSSSSSSIPFAHLSFFKSLSKNTNATQIGNDNDGGEKKNQQQQRQQQQQTQENCYQCRVVGTSACAVAASVVAYDRILGTTKRPLAHSLLYGAFGLGFAGLGVLRWNDLTFEDAEEMWRKLF